MILGCKDFVDEPGKNRFGIAWGLQVHAQQQFKVCEDPKVPYSSFPETPSELKNHFLNTTNGYKIMTSGASDMFKPYS